MAEVIGVRFKEGGKVYFFEPCGIIVKAGDAVIVETARGLECGTVVEGNREVSEADLVKPLKKAVRPASEKDIAQMEENHRREAHAFQVCQQKIIEHKMDMKLVDVEYTFDNSKILFYFTADGRVDFRDLVKDLAGIFRTRIELRQIGVRDEAKMLGGLGICGRVFCCTQFLSDFQPVSIKMAKEQGLSLNPTKISGACGRLMCCLKYEQNAYDDLIRTTPRIGSPVETPEGHGTVAEIVNILTGTMKIRLDQGDGYSFKTFGKNDITPLRDERRPAPKAAKVEGVAQDAAAERTESPQQQRPPRRPKAGAPAEAGQERKPERRQRPPRPKNPNNGGNAGGINGGGTAAANNTAAKKEEKQQ